MISAGDEKKTVSDMEMLLRIFTVPENANTTLGRIERDISENLMGFLKDHIVAEEISSADLERDFLDTEILWEPVRVSDQADFLIDKVVAKSVHTSSPSFLGHMTTSIPYFMLPLAKIMIALNQNLVKMETSKSFTPLERQVIGMIHRLVYQLDDGFYRRTMQLPELALGCITSDGTIANLTALWVALNTRFPASETFAGVGEEGIAATLNHHDLNGLVILVSERGHYSLSKAAHVLGIGRKNLIAIPTDNQNKIRLDILEEKISELRDKRIGIIAIVGIAGTTETGNVDPLENLSRICEREAIHFHVDAAWGGPTLFSRTYSHLLRGIEKADSVTIDAHKQLYVPIGAGLALFKKETALQSIEHFAEYIIRKGSRDQGRTTLEGSRPGMAMLIHSGLKIIARKGYELLIDLGIEKARAFAEMIKEMPDFELLTEPELNLLTYRYVPNAARAELDSPFSTEKKSINEQINRLTIAIQKLQREGGKTFVSRTALEVKKYDNQLINVFRVVLANPMTTPEILQDMLREQCLIAREILAANPDLS